MVTATTRDGSPWTPNFLEAIDEAACIGCGRCFKACGQSVLEPVERAGDDDDDEECATTVMRVAQPGACIGCGACSRVCGRKAQSYTAC